MIYSRWLPLNYFDRIKKLTNENLTRTDSLLRENLINVDSLRQVYMRVMLEESKKEFTGTSIDLGGTKTSTKEIELFSTDRKINEELGLIAVEIALCREKLQYLMLLSVHQLKAVLALKLMHELLPLFASGHLKVHWVNV